ncbi:hypothetical protein BLL52_3565 [Rhodoferax antarcticus ANT.BR]|uniref:Uncharacterized protein n=1 Tax=Rhodoferax antarcticus ANT.BR TaxID=1111071 RepID=A0A1Q8YBH3_9BURK|nr:hypothetical protein BLL52_3565 [Rhodoferax antarcticus ANT.BR]
MTPPGRFAVLMRRLDNQRQLCQNTQHQAKELIAVWAMTG